MGEILAILFQPPHAPSTLANCYRMRRLRQHFATACAAYTSKVLPHAPSTLAKHTILHGFATTCAVYASNLLPHAPHSLAICYACDVYVSNLHPHTIAICYRMRHIRQQSATACAAYASNLQAYAPHTLANLQAYAQHTLPKTHFYNTLVCYRMRHLRQQFATVCAAYASKVLPHAQSTLAKHTIYTVLLPHAPFTLAICYRMRRIRQQHATACAVYASKADRMLILPL